MYLPLRLLTGLLLGLALTLHAQPEQKKADAPRSLRVSLIDLSGTTHDLGQNDTRRVRAFVFLSLECPIANACIPTLNTLHARFKDRLDLFGVVSDPAVKRSEASKHFRNFKAGFPVLFDASGQLAELLQPTHVPEAFVLDGDGRIIYRGALDNAWLDLGRRRIRAEKHYLADALEAALAGKRPAVERTLVVGCLFEKPPAPEAKAQVSYARDIAPILQARCQSCHRDGQAAPFPLDNYDSAARRAGQIVRVTQARIMPPWMPVAGHERLVGERWLSDRELALLKEWANTGRARGDEADLPPAAKFAEGWQLGKPDLIVRMPQPFTIPADGPDLLHNFVLPLNIAEDKLVRAIEFRPGNTRVAHHAVLFLDDSGTARKLDAATPEPGYSNFSGPGFFPSGALGGWSVGNTPRPLPNGMGRYLKKGSDLVVQMHYHPTGRQEIDQSEVGIYFINRPVQEVLKEPAKLVGSIWVSNYDIDIPAGEQNYRRSTSYTLPRDVILVGVVPHMHLLGKSMRVLARLPDGSKRVLIDIPRWNYHWQDEYYYERPFPLPKGTRLEVEAVFDNSEGNPSNPSSPPKRVTWGDGTNDEMLFCFFLLSAPKTEDLVHVILDNLQHDLRQPRKRPAGGKK